MSKESPAGSCALELEVDRLEHEARPGLERPLHVWRECGQDVLRVSRGSYRQLARGVGIPLQSGRIELVQLQPQGRVADLVVREAQAVDPVRRRHVEQRPGGVDRFVAPYLQPVDREQRLAAERRIGCRDALDR